MIPIKMERDLPDDGIDYPIIKEESMTIQQEALGQKQEEGRSERLFYKVLKIGHKSEDSKEFNHFIELKNRYNVNLCECKIQRIVLYEKNFEDGIKCGLQVWYQHLKTGKIWQTEKQFPEKGEGQELILEEDEFLKKVAISKGIFVDQQVFSGIQLITSKWKELNGTRKGGTFQKFDVPSEYQVLGFYGVIDNQGFLSNLGLYLKRDYYST